MVSPTVDRRFGLVGNAALKAPVLVVATSNITLSGEQTIDGKAVSHLNASSVPDRVLCAGQTDATQNGIYDVSTGAWSRSADADGPYDFVKGTTVFVTDGTAGVGTYWQLTTAGPITVGTTAMTWESVLDGINTALASATAQAVIATAEAAIATAEAVIATADATAAGLAADRAESASVTAGAYPNTAASNVPRGLTQASVGAITAGSGGTNGTFALGWSGGNFSINPTGTFTVAGGVLTAVTITGPGLYIGSSPTVPTRSFAASAGLGGGAAVVLTAQFLVTSGQGYWVQSVDGTQLLHYLNSSGVATLDTSVSAIPNIDVSTRLDTIVGAKYQTIGRTGTPVIGTDHSDNTVAFLTPVSRDGQIKHVRAYLGVGTTALHVKVFRVSGTSLTQISDTSIAAAAGLNSFDADLAAFTAISVVAGDIIGFYSTGGRLQFAAGTDNWTQAAGNVTSLTISFLTGTAWAIGFDIQAYNHLKQVDAEAVDRRSQRVGSLVTQTIGRPSVATLTTGSVAPGQTYVFLETVTEEAVLKTVRIYSAGIGALDIWAFDLIGSVLVATGTKLTLTLAAGLNTFSSANGDFVQLHFKRGQRIGFWGGARLIDVVATSDSSGFYNGQGNNTVGGTVFPNTNVGTTVQFQISFDLEYFLSSAVPFVLTTQAAYDALTKDATTLYGIA